MPVQGVRGATVALENQPESILAETRRLLDAILEANPSLKVSDLASLLFTTTADLNATYPAQAARQMGWTNVPMMCMQEIQVPDGLPLCIRVLLHWNTELNQDSIQHVYLGKAASLRPDLVNKTR